jgi:hypothetical protein
MTIIDLGLLILGIALYSWGMATLFDRVNIECIKYFAYKRKKREEFYAIPWEERKGKLFEDYWKDVK